MLIALDALLEENSVAAAADMLHLSPPAMSRTLARIRKATGDDILVRTGRTMTPTPHALAMREETKALVARATALLTPVTALDLGTLDRSFTLRCHDALVTALAPALTAAISEAAPNVSIRFLAEPSADLADLARGQTDLEVGAAAPERPEIVARNVGNDRMVAVMRTDHPLATSLLTPQRFADADHVTVSRRGRLTGPIDDALADLGLRRRVRASLPTSNAALELAARTTMLTAVAEQACRTAWTSLGLCARALPFDLPPVPVIVAWHRRYDTDPAHTWLRDQLLTTLRSILTTPGPETLRPTAPDPS
ncbi:LysR family transcriptional regulator [Streptantibioticus parmotrematis]|uniref:LysR family transcriptional regulator n=1 Tax=Streptantibioticus parmotrematis TaxID=2873249 RepID=UPI0027DFFF2C|nr:LysR family transcriptional regulator [Streptantibioticus parmotrematis]